MKFDYPKICRGLFQGLSERNKEVISRRFGLETGNRETLEAIGKSYGITRERVRQLEVDGFQKMKPGVMKFKGLLDHFSGELKETGGLRKEDILLNTLGEARFQNYVFFLLTLADPYTRFSENRDFHSLWCLNPESYRLAQKVVDSLTGQMVKINHPVDIANYPIAGFKITPQALSAYLEASKIIQKGPEGLFGLTSWPEISPRGVKDKAYLVFKREKRPLHFSEVAKKIGEDALPQTVHNELIKDPRFVLVGRGLYALKEWGYEPGVVKDIIVKTLKETKEPLSREEIIAAVLKQRFVKENTISLNLSDKQLFLRTPEGKYTIRQI